jgi:hypothetical protein
VEQARAENLPGADSADVPDPGVREVIAEESGLPGPIGEIDLLVVQEEALVEAAQFLEHGPPDKEERTDDLVHRAAVVDLAHGHPLARHQPGKQPGETTCPGHDHRQPREPGTGLLEGAVVLHHLAAADAHARRVRAGEESDRSVKGVRVEPGIGIEEQHEGSVPFVCALVAGCRESAVVRVADGAQRQGQVVETVRGSVGGGVVHHDHAGERVCGASGRGDGVQASVQAPARVPVDDDDVEAR